MATFIKLKNRNGDILHPQTSANIVSVTDVQTLDLKLQEMDGEIGTNKTNIQTVTTEVENARTTGANPPHTYTSLKERLDDMSQGNDDIKTELEQAKGNFDTLNDRLDNVENDVTNIKVDIVDLGSDLSALEREVQTAKGDVQTVQTELGNLQTTIGDVRNEMNNVKQEVEDSRGGENTLNERLDKMQDEITNLVGGGGNVDLSEVTDARTDLGGNTFDSLKQRLDNDYTALYQEIGLVSNEVVLLDNEIYDARTDHFTRTEHDTLFQRLEADFNHLDGRVSGNTSSLNSYQQQIRTIQTEVRNARTDVGGQAHATLVERLNSDYNFLEDKFDSYLPINGGTMQGSITMGTGELVGNAQTATKMKADRRIKIGNGTAKSFNDETNLVWNVSDIGIDWNGNGHILNKPSVKTGNGLNSIIANTGREANGENAFAEGSGTRANGNYAHAEGYNTQANETASHAEGGTTQANGAYSHAEGYTTIATGERSHAEGYSTRSEGENSHAEGQNSKAVGKNSHAEGQNSTASGEASHAEGYRSETIGNYSHANGYYAIANGYAQTVIGKYNIPSGTATSSPNTDNAFIIGNGTFSTTSNAFRVTWGGDVYGAKAYNTGGADYAEMFEWSDGNSNGEDRRGYFVAFDTNTNMIRKATSSDTFVLGAVATDSAMIGDNHDYWEGKYARDEWDNIIYDRVQGDDGNYHDVPRLNPTYDPDKEYIPREFRKEWSPIGLLGKVLVYSDGTCRVGQYCKPNDDGIATKSNDGYYVLEVRPNNIVKVLIK